MNNDEVIGKLLIVGLSKVDSHGRRIAQTQLHGRVLRVSENEGLVLELPDGSEYYLPPDLTALQPAPPGEYMEHSSGETIAGPDFIVMWEIHQSREDPNAASWQKGPTIEWPRA
jgi:hypothetical protein